MSQEEFDNRLRSSFQDDYIPPKDHLWVNIAEKLEQKSRKPLWYWLLPVLIAISASLAWLGNSLINGNKDKTISTEQVVQPAITSTGHASADLDKNTVESEEIILAESTDAKSQAQSDAQNPSSSKSPNKASTNYNENPSVNPKSNSSSNHSNSDNSQSSRGSSQNASNTNSNIKNSNALDDYFNKPDNSFGLSNKPNTVAGSIYQDQTLASIHYVLNFPNFTPSIDTELEAPLYVIDENRAPEKKRNKAKKDRTADMRSLRWLSFGIGPQIALNSLKISDDSQAYIHHHLWENKNKVTHNGIGINSFLSFNYKFGKKNRFSFETGLNYSLRTEDIKFNESSYNIATRDPKSHIITSYIPHLRLYIISGPNDTTFYDATQGFTMFKKNKYNIFTVPFRLNSEHRISEKTYFSFGLGGGFSMISTKNNTHYNMVQEREETTLKSTEFSASLNGIMSLYTNFNELGQVGIYTGFQSYLQPWKLANKQYGIRMGDIQFGLTFRRPLK